MKKTLVGPCSGRFHRVGALILCVMLASCTSTVQKFQKDITLWQAAGSPPVVSCSYPFELKTPAPSGSMASQAYPSLRDFLPAAAAAQAPIQECAAIGGSDDAAQIAKASWGSLGYATLHAWRPATALIGWEFTYTWRVMDSPPPGPQVDDYYVNPSYSDIPETGRYSKTITVPYGAWYLAYQRIPQDDEQARRQGAGLYAMQGFRCAIHMRDFPAARRYWALALSSNPGSAAAYGQIALQSFFQVLFARSRSNKNDSDGAPDYLNLPQDIRRAVWDAAGQRYAAEGGGTVTMAQAEEAARAGQLDPVISTKIPTLSLLYCPVFYPDFDPIPITPGWYFSFSFPANMLNSATQRAAGTAGRGK